MIHNPLSEEALLLSAHSPIARQLVSQVRPDDLPSYLPATGFLRLPQVLALIPISRSAWWAGVKKGRYPAPVKLSPRCSAWTVSSIRELIERLAEGQKHSQ